MAIDYAIAAIPTLYRGRRYRSRLEARWAAFFDRLGWQHEYEPFDLGAWSPDFLITAPVEGSRVLAEVKPTLDADADTIEKMRRAIEEKKWDDEISGALLIGTNPVLDRGWCRIGHLLTWSGGTRQLCPGRLAWIPEDSGPSFRVDVIAPPSFPEDRWCGLFSYMPSEHAPETIAKSYGNHSLHLWAEASNDAQWCGRSAV